MKWDKERIYALGTWFYKDLEKGINETYREKIEMLTNVLHNYMACPTPHMDWKNYCDQKHSYFKIKLYNY